MIEVPPANHAASSHGPGGSSWDPRILEEARFEALRTAGPSRPGRYCTAPAHPWQTALRKQNPLRHSRGLSRPKTGHGARYPQIPVQIRGLRASVSINSATKLLIQCVLNRTAPTKPPPPILPSQGGYQPHDLGCPHQKPVNHPRFPPRSPSPLL